MEEREKGKKEETEEIRMGQLNGNGNEKRKEAMEMFH